MRGKRPRAGRHTAHGRSRMIPLRLAGELAGLHKGVFTIAHDDPFHSSASVRLLPATVLSPTATQFVPPHDTSCSADPLPAETGLADVHPLPFQNWLVRMPPRVMQLVELAHATAPAHAHDWNSGQMPPRLGDTSVQVWLVASNLSPTAMLARAESLEATPADMQNVPAQDTVLS